MFDCAVSDERLRRPRILLRAAEAGRADYDRNRELRRLFHGRVPGPAAAVAELRAIEAQLEEQRIAGDAAYSVTRHVTLLIAILAEMRLAARCDGHP